jgi:hypothetical protein
MVLEVLKSMFGRRIRLPRDVVTRVPRAARKAAEPQVAAIQAAIDAIAALPGLADVATTKKLPKGFFAAVQALTAAYDGYIAAVVKAVPGLQPRRRAGHAGGVAGVPRAAGRRDGRRGAGDLPGEPAVEGLRGGRAGAGAARRAAVQGHPGAAHRQGPGQDQHDGHGGAAGAHRLREARGELCPLLDPRRTAVGRGTSGRSRVACTHPRRRERGRPA